jgi:phosphate:Na+ symporter
VVNAIKQEDESKQLMTLINRFDYLFQLHDSINDLFDSKRIMKEQYIELKSDVLLIVRSLSSQTLEFFDDIGDAMEHKQVINAKSLSKALQHNIDDANRALLLLLIDPKREDAGALTNFVTYSQRMKDKLYSFASLTLNQDSVATTFEKSIESA